MATIDIGTDIPVYAYDCGLGQTEKGTEYIFVRFQELEGEDTITHYYYLSEKALKNSLTNLREVFGFGGDFENLEKYIRFAHCYITVAEESWNGKTTLRVKWVNKQPRAMTATQVPDNLRAKLTARAKAAGEYKPTPIPAREPIGKEPPIGSYTNPF